MLSAVVKQEIRHFFLAPKLPDPLTQKLFCFPQTLDPMKHRPWLAAAAAALLIPTAAPAASIAWVSDLLPVGSGTSDNDGGADGIFGPGAGPYPDQGIVNLLTGAGHSVTRFNPSGSQPLSAANVAALNAFDLVIIGRSIGSGAFDSAAEALEWNTSITKPLMSTNTYMSRASRLGWFVGSTQPDQVSNVLTFTNPGDAVSSYIIGGTALNGSTMVNSYTEAIVYPDSAVDTRGISTITDAPVAGATTIATGPVGAATGQFIVSLPAGLTLTPGSGPGNNQVLGGYRMMFLVGNRESATAPNTVIGNAGFENLTAEGEGMFLRAVTVAANGGVIPEPASTTLLLLAGASLILRRRA